MRNTFFFLFGMLLLSLLSLSVQVEYFAQLHAGRNMYERKSQNCWASSLIGGLTPNVVINARWQNYVVNSENDGSELHSPFHWAADESAQATCTFAQNSSPVIIDGIELLSERTREREGGTYVR